MEKITKASVLGLEKGNFIVIQYFNQWAEGITGATRSLTVLTQNGIGFATKKEAREKFKELKEASYHGYKNVKGTPGPYGNVGCVDYKIKFLNVKQLKEFIEKNSYYYSCPTFGSVN